MHFVMAVGLAGVVMGLGVSVSLQQKFERKVKKRKMEIYVT